MQRKSRKLDNIKEFLDEDCVDKCDDGKLFQKQPPEMFCKKGVLKSLAIFTGEHLCRRLLLIKLQACVRKETPTQVFSCEYCEIFKNTYFEEHLRTAVLYFIISNNS